MINWPTPEQVKEAQQFECWFIKKCQRGTAWKRPRYVQPDYSPCTDPMPVRDYDKVDGL